MPRSNKTPPSIHKISNRVHLLYIFLNEYRRSFEAQELFIRLLLLSLESWIIKTSKDLGKEKEAISIKDIASEIRTEILDSIRRTKPLKIREFLRNVVLKTRTKINELDDISKQLTVLADIQKRERTLMLLWAQCQSSSSCLDLPLALEAKLLSGLL